jgi:hypothetical protein
MRSTKTLLLLLLLTQFFCIMADAQEIPYRKMKMVKDIYKEPDKFAYLVSPDEEKSEKQVISIPETDIKAVSGCYDKYRLRIDVLIVKPVSNKFKIWYSLELGFADFTEKYIFYPLSGELRYMRLLNGKTTDEKILNDSNSKDWAEVSPVGNLTASDILFIIDKDNHIGGEKGKDYSFTLTAYSGYVNKDNEQIEIDKTLPVDVEFKR